VTIGFWLATAIIGATIRITMGEDGGLLFAPPLWIAYGIFNVKRGGKWTGVFLLAIPLYGLFLIGDMY
jgi:hypothetical protein